MSAHPAFDRLIKQLRKLDAECVEAVLGLLPLEEYRFQYGRHLALQEAISLTQEAQKTWLSGDDEDGQES